MHQAPSFELSTLPITGDHGEIPVDYSPVDSSNPVGSRS